MRQTRLCPKKLCTSSAVSFSPPRSKRRRQESYLEKTQTESTLHRQAGIVRRLARRRTIQVGGALFVSARNLVCLKSMRVACGFVFLDNQTRVALEALRILGVGTRSSRFSHSTCEHGVRRTAAAPSQNLEVVMPFTRGGGTHPQQNAVGVEFSPVGDRHT